RDPVLRARRSHGATGAVEGRAASPRVGVHVGGRRNEHLLWRPLQGLTLADYVITGAVSGDLFGQPFQVGYFAPASQSRIVPGNGRILTNRGGYRQDAVTADVTAEGRAVGRLRWRAPVSVGDWAGDV